MLSARTVQRLITRAEAAQVLDKPADLLADLLRRVIRPGVVEDVLSGTPIGHPAHPALVAVPIGSWSTALVLDLTGGDADAARRAVAIGTLSALPAALTGANDWLTTAGPERRVGLVHAAANYAGLFLQAGSWVARGRGQRRKGALLSLGAMTLVGAGGWLGGHLAYAMGVGVDTTAFQKLPDEWLDIAAESAVPADRAIAVDARGVPVLLVRHDRGIIALADRCTHRGAPLHEGPLERGCIICPWHGSAFALDDGEVLSGPATRPQPALDVEVTNGRVRVRRHEERTLRVNPTGH